MLKWGFIGTALIGLAVLVFDPIGWRYFLLDAEFAKSLRPIAFVGGAVGGVLLLCLIAYQYSKTLRDFEAGLINENDPAYSQMPGPLGRTFVVACSPLLGFGFIYMPTMSLLPTTLHRLSSLHVVSESFRIVGTVRRKGCRGVRAENPDYYDDELCGVLARSPYGEHKGETLVLEGERSPYGFLHQRYFLKPNQSID